MRTTVTKTINYPRALYTALRELAAQRQRQMPDDETFTNRDQVREAIDGQLDAVEQLLTDAGFGGPEDKRHPVRCAIDTDVDARIQGVAQKLGVDYAAVLIACLRRQNDLRLKDAAGKQLRASVTEQAPKEDGSNG